MIKIIIIFACLLVKVETVLGIPMNFTMKQLKLVNNDFFPQILYRHLSYLQPF